MKRFITAAAAALVALATVSVSADGSIGTAGIEMDFNSDGVTDSRDWTEMKEWVTNYKMTDGDVTYYGNQEVPASINLLIDRKYGSDMENRHEFDTASVPQYYLPSLGDTTSIKDQSPFGTCWAFGSIATLESNLLHKRHGNSGVINPDGFELNVKNVSNELDLSELYHAYMNMEQVRDGSQKGEGTSPLDPDVLNSHFQTGGFASSSQMLFTSWISPLAESQEPYKPLDKKVDGKEAYDLRNPEDDSTSPRLAHVQEFMYIDSPAKYHIDVTQGKYLYDSYRPEAVDIIKQMMIRYGALMMSYQADSSMPGDSGNSDYMNYEYFCQYNDAQEVGTNHLVTIVGWNDDYPRENFKTDKGGLPEHNGAFLIKNSWGNYDYSLEKYGDRFTQVYNTFASSKEGRMLLMGFNYGVPDEEGHGTGYAWVSYEDHSISDITAIDSDDAIDGFDYDHIYQYDYCNPVAFYPISLPTDNSETLNANVFTCQQDEKLAAVSVYAPVNNTTAEVEVYRLTADTLNPTEGELLAAATASYDSHGFHTLKLEKPADLKAGDRFAIVESIQTEKDGKKVSWLNIEETIRQDLQTADNINKEHAAVVSNPGETLVYVNNGTEHVWADASELNSTAAGSIMAFGNAYIKAYTISPDKAPLPTADPTYQGIPAGDDANFRSVLLIANLPKIIMIGAVVLVIIIGLIIFLIVRSIRKKKAKKAKEAEAAKAAADAENAEKGSE